MSKYRDPGQVEKMMKIEADIRKMEQHNEAVDKYNKDKKAKKKQSKKECSACGQESLTGSTYGG